MLSKESSLSETSSLSFESLMHTYVPQFFVLCKSCVHLFCMLLLTLNLLISISSALSKFLFSAYAVMNGLCRCRFKTVNAMALPRHLLQSYTEVVQSAHPVLNLRQPSHLWSNFMKQSASQCTRSETVSLAVLRSLSIPSITLMIEFSCRFLYYFEEVLDSYRNPLMPPIFTQEPAEICLSRLCIHPICRLATLWGVGAVLDVKVKEFDGTVVGKGSVRYILSLHRHLCVPVFSLGRLICSSGNYL